MTVRRSPDHSSFILRVSCHACGHAFEAPSHSLEVRCEKCSARITLTSMATKPRASGGSDLPDLIGHDLGGFRITALLGGGGMGLVFEAERTDAVTFATPPKVALKLLAPELARDSEFVERFHREADALTRLRHVNLIEVYGKGEVELPNGARGYFFVMERFEGRDLRGLLADGPVPPLLASAIVRHAAAGLSFAHEHGVVHRDIKPANILVRGDPLTDGAVKVVDFGVAQLAGGAQALPSLTRSQLILGTINYMSPEQRIDASEIDQRTDVYALGVVAYELLTGRLPIGAFEPPSELVRGLAKTADRAILSALRRDPAQRPSAILDFASSLDRALTPTNRRGLLAATAVAAALGLLVIGLGMQPLVDAGRARDAASREKKVLTSKAQVVTNDDAAQLENVKNAPPEPPNQPKPANTQSDSTESPALTSFADTLTRQARFALERSKKGAQRGEAPKKSKSIRKPSPDLKK